MKVNSSLVDKAKLGATSILAGGATSLMLNSMIPSNLTNVALHGSVFSAVYYMTLPSTLIKKKSKNKKFFTGLDFKIASALGLAGASMQLNKYDLAPIAQLFDSFSGNFSSAYGNLENVTLANGEFEDMVKKTTKQNLAYFTTVASNTCFTFLINYYLLGSFVNSMRKKTFFPGMKRLFRTGLKSMFRKDKNKDYYSLSELDSTFLVNVINKKVKNNETEDAMALVSHFNKYDYSNRFIHPFMRFSIDRGVYFLEKKYERDPKTNFLELLYLNLLTGKEDDFSNVKELFEKHIEKYDSLDLRILQARTYEHFDREESDNLWNFIIPNVINKAIDNFDKIGSTKNTVFEIDGSEHYKGTFIFKTGPNLNDLNLELRQLKYFYYLLNIEESRPLGLYKFNEFDFLVSRRAPGLMLSEAINELGEKDIRKIVDQAEDQIYQVHKSGTKELDVGVFDYDRVVEEDKNYFSKKIERLLFLELEKRKKEEIPIEIKKDILEGVREIEKEFLQVPLAYYYDTNPRNFSVTHTLKLIPYDFEKTRKMPITFDYVIFYDGINQSFEPKINDIYDKYEEDMNGSDVEMLYKNFLLTRGYMGLQDAGYNLKKNEKINLTDIINDLEKAKINLNEFKSLNGLNGNSKKYERTLQGISSLESWIDSI